MSSRSARHLPPRGSRWPFRFVVVLGVALVAMLGYFGWGKYQTSQITPVVQEASLRLDRLMGESRTVTYADEMREAAELGRYTDEQVTHLQVEYGDDNQAAAKAVALLRAIGETARSYGYFIRKDVARQAAGRAFRSIRDEAATSDFARQVVNSRLREFRSSLEEFGSAATQFGDALKDLVAATEVAATVFPKGVLPNSREYQRTMAEAIAAVEAVAARTGL